METKPINVVPAPPPRQPTAIYNCYYEASNKTYCIHIDAPFVVHGPFTVSLEDDYLVFKRDPFGNVDFVREGGEYLDCMRFFVQEELPIGVNYHAEFTKLESGFKISTKVPKPDPKERAPKLNKFCQWLFD